MADVFLAVQIGEESFNRLVVIKRIHSMWLTHENAMKMFIDEAQTVAALNHPHIVKIFDLSRLDKDICIAMEYVDGENLDYIRKSLKKANSRMPLPIVCKLMVEACEALHYAHSARRPDGRPLQLVHRDIAPHNLMLASNGYLKIIDFGIAKSNAQSELTSPGMIKGKFSYLAPDLFRFKEIDGKVDIYALGLVFYELITLKKPFLYSKEVTVAEVIDRVLNEQLAPPSAVNPDIPKQLDEVILKAVHKDRDSRYQTGEQLAMDIREFSESFGGLATSSDVDHWFNELFGDRIAKRREFERKAMAKAKQLMEAGPQAPQQNSLNEMTANISHVQLTSGSYATEAKRLNPYVFAVVLFILFAGGATLGAILVHQLFFKEKAAAPGQPAQSAVLATASNNLFVASSPPEADLYVDGNRVGSTGTSGIGIPVEPGKPHSIMVQKQGYENYSVQVVADAKSQRRIDARLTSLSAANQDKEPPKEQVAMTSPAPKNDNDKPGNRKAPPKPAPPPQRGAKPGHDAKGKGRDKDEEKTPSPADSTKVASAAPLTPALSSPAATPASSPTTPPPALLPQPEPPKPVVAAAPTPPPASQPEDKDEDADKGANQAPLVIQWYSGSGNWSGEQVANQGCNKCHNGGKAPKLAWDQKTKGQWTFFFQRSKHDRHVKLAQYFSKLELQRVMDHILNILQGKKKSGIAGVK